MKAVGIVRRIDHLGRLVIPKEFRRTLGINENDPMEILVTDDGILARPYKRGKEIAAERFARVILENASAHGLSIWQLEKACNLAISLCREVSIPTLEALQRDQES